MSYICKFNWKILQRTCKGKEIINFFMYKVTRNKTFFTTPVQKYFLYSEKSIKDSFLLNVTELLVSEATLDEKLVYIQLASLRSYSEYCIRQKKYLNLEIIDIDANKLKHNTLLRIENNKIYFKYE